MKKTMLAACSLLLGFAANSASAADEGATATYSGTGTYTVSDNCIATVSYDSETVPWVYFISADGDHYYWNNMPSGTTWTTF